MEIFTASGNTLKLVAYVSGCTGGVLIASIGVLASVSMIGIGAFLLCVSDGLCKKAFELNIYAMELGDLSIDELEELFIPSEA